MTFLELKKNLAERFSQAGFESADLEAHYLVCEAAAIPDREFPLYAHEPLSSEAQARAESFAVRRLKNEPWQQNARLLSLRRCLPQKTDE